MNLKTTAYNFLLARLDRYGCSSIGDLVDFAREREIAIADELERLRLFFDAYSYDDQHLKRYIEQLRKGERE